MGKLDLGLLSPFLVGAVLADLVVAVFAAPLAQVLGVCHLSFCSVPVVDFVTGLVRPGTSCLIASRSHQLCLLFPLATFARVLR